MSVLTRWSNSPAPAADTRQIIVVAPVGRPPSSGRHPPLAVGRLGYPLLAASPAKSRVVLACSFWMLADLGCGRVISPENAGHHLPATVDREVPALRAAPKDVPVAAHSICTVCCSIFNCRSTRLLLVDGGRKMVVGGPTGATEMHPRTSTAGAAELNRRFRI